jgi:hypothetical protein
MTSLCFTVSFPPAALRPNAAMASSCLKFLAHTQTHQSRYDSFGRVLIPTQRPLPDNTQRSQETTMPPEGFEPTTSADARPQTYALDRVAAGTGYSLHIPLRIAKWAHITSNVLIFLVCVTGDIRTKVYITHSLTLCVCVCVCVCVFVFVMYLHITFQTFRSGSSLVVAVKRRTKRTLREVAIVILYSQARRTRVQ